MRYVSFALLSRYFLNMSSARLFVFKRTLHFFLEIGSFYNLNSQVLPFLNPFRRSPGLAVALLA